MPRYKLFYLRDSLVQRFRESAPKTKPYGLHLRDYEEAREIEALGPYGAWKQLREETEESAQRAFGVGDAIESEESALSVLNYWGFDEAAWQLSESGAESSGAEPVGESAELQS
ncbi:MAG: hypothetical protein O2968_04905 [Acidobacteria bacterium]|nr:hypothetical protein [Acidobacteriota bacterium]